MRHFIFLFFVFSFSSAISQTPQYSSLIGLRTSGSFNNYYESGVQKIYFQLGFKPYYMFFLAKNFGFGVVGEIDFVVGNMNKSEYPETIYGVGPISRFYYPFDSERISTFKFRIYSEASFSMTNYYVTNQSYYYSELNRLEFSILRIIPLGFTINFNEGLNLDISPVINKNFPGRWSLGMNFGIEYHFSRR